MVQTISISTSGDFLRAERVLKRATLRLPLMTISAMMKWGKILERDIKNSLLINSNSFTGVSKNKGIEYRQGKKSNVGHLFMREYLLSLDHMRPHYVSVKRSRTRLLSWAMQANSSVIRKKARAVNRGSLKRFGIFVRPHPFISTGFRRARPKLNRIIKREVGRIIKT